MIAFLLAATLTWAQDPEAPPECPPGHPPVGPGASATRFGPVMETMNSSGYTYVRVETPAGLVWVAGPEVEVAVGDQVATTEGAMMVDFISPTLGRTFDELYLVGEIAVLQGTGGAHAAPEAVSVGPLVPVAGGTTVEKIVRDAADHSPVQLRARVARVSTGILGRNWLHVQDGTGDASKGTHDLVVTTTAVAQVGDVVDIQGMVARDRDFGQGYRYAVLVEDAVLNAVP